MPKPSRLALKMRRYREQRGARDRSLVAAQATYRRRWQEANRDKHNAHNAVYRAVKSGRLVRPTACGRCGDPCKPEASHDDYSQPLDVEWLCRTCHARKDAGLAA